jgi:hypothetical protein
VPNVLWVVDKIPEGDDMFKPMDDDAQLAAAIFRHNPDHRWWYFSGEYPLFREGSIDVLTFAGMEKDEALLFKFHDSDSSVGWRVPHSAFWDDSFPETRKVRESIECRTIAFFEN